MTDEEKMTQERRTHDPMLYDGSIEPLPNRPGINNSIGEQRIEYAAPGRIAYESFRFLPLTRTFAQSRAVRRSWYP